MGCFFGKEASSAASATRSRKEKSKTSLSQSQATLTTVETGVDVPNAERGGDKHKKGKDGAGGAAAVLHRGSQQQQRPERNQKPDPRRGNLPKQAHGEQVAAGWPSWLSRDAGEAIRGMVPRRADSFEKIVKVNPLFPLQSLIFPVPIGFPLSSG